MLGSRKPGGPDLERHLFWRGQLLGSRDLNDVNAGEEERLFWHNRAVHDAYGVVSGLKVLVVKGVPPEVMVSPGLAYDAYGRELAVHAPVPLPSPGEVSEVWALVLRYREETANGAGAARSELVWRLARRVGLKDGVVLARWGNIEDAKKPFGLEEGFRPLRARPFARPRLGHGETPRGGTAWRLWFQSGTGGTEVSIDTSAAGFTRTPCYFAWLQGGLWQVSHRLVRTVPLERITAASRDRFTFSLWDPASSPFNQGDGTTQLLNLALQRLYVCWLGIEMDPTAFPKTELR